MHHSSHIHAFPSVKQCVIYIYKVNVVEKSIIAKTQQAILAHYPYLHSHRFGIIDFIRTFPYRDQIITVNL